MTAITATDRPPLGILMLEGKMSVEPGCMACPDTWPYPVIRHTVKGSKTPTYADDAWNMLPLYLDAAKQLEAKGVGAMTANCGLIALLHKELSAAVKVPIVTSGLLLVPSLHRMMPDKRIGILTFHTHAVSERNYNASGWSEKEIPIALGGIGECESWLEFLATKEIPDTLRPQLEADLIASAKRLLDENPDIGCFVSECTMLPTCLPAVREAVRMPVYDILTLLDLTMSGYYRPADLGRGVAPQLAAVGA